jgi:hypothetical protein
MGQTADVKMGEFATSRFNIITTQTTDSISLAAVKHPQFAQRLSSDRLTSKSKVIHLICESQDAF